MKDLPTNYVRESIYPCPKCGFRRWVYHIMPRDYAKYCAKCEHEFQGGN